ncbi:MAG: ATP-dependent DNA ligase [Opitutales bacterium]|nr:ATP-dependent DNA ligase [Opitutales bacterium]
MRQFAALVLNLDQTTSLNRKIDLLARFFAEAPPGDRVWTIALFTGRRPRRQINARLFREVVLAETGIPEWLFGECYAQVGDLAETAALLLPPSSQTSDDTLTRWIERIQNSGKASEEEKQNFLRQSWAQLDRDQRFVFNKLITGGFRLGISQKIILRALAQTLEQPAEQLAHRLMGDWNPQEFRWDDLVRPKAADQDSRPYPFCLAYPLEKDPRSCPPGDLHEWTCEWKWDGIRAQLIQRSQQTYLWSRGEELVTPQFPELLPPASHLPDGTVLDGEILPWQGKATNPLTFQDLQKRLNRKKPGAATVRSTPVIFMAYDLLEHNGQDVRGKPFCERRRILETLFAKNLPESPLRLSPLVHQKSWSRLAQERSRSRTIGAEGFMLKKNDSPYSVGRKKGLWWKWKVDPLTADAVLVYAQRGHGRRSGQFTDYTFAVWDGDQLVPFAKAYSGLTNKEIQEADRWIKKHTKEKFGPVRTVEPKLVFEIGFEGIYPSKRHKSGLAVRFPRILRWRQDKLPGDADSLETLRTLLAQASPK